MSAPVIDTPRLCLVAATPRPLRAEMSDTLLLGSLLNAEVSPEWPPDYNDLSTMQHMLNLVESDPANLAWGYYYVVIRTSPTGRRLAGGCGFKGKPDKSGMVEIGYSLLRAFQRQGYGTEAVAGLLRHAFANASVTAVIAETFPALVASLRVLEKSGFVSAGEGSEAGSIRYCLLRPVAG